MSELEPPDGIDEEEIVLHPWRYPDIHKQAFSRLLNRGTQPFPPENAATRLRRRSLENLGVEEVVPGHNNYRLPT